MLELAFGEWSEGDQRIGRTPSFAQSCAVDSEAGLLYVYRRRPRGFVFLSPVGIESYDLKSGKLKRITRIPANPELGGSAIIKSEGDAYFDVRRGRVYVTQIFDGLNWILFELDLTHDRPGLISRDDLEFRWSAAATIDSDYLMLVRVKPGEPPGGPRIDDIGVYAIAEKELRDYRLPDNLRLPRCVPWPIAVVGSSVLLVDRGTSPGMYLLDPEADSLRGAKSQSTAPWRCNWSAVCSRRRLLVAAEATVGAEVHFSRDPSRFRVRTYDLQSLQPVRDIDFGAYGPLAIVPGTDLLLVKPEEDRQSLRVFDVTNGAELVRLPLTVQAGGGEPWHRLVCDQYGRYVGALGYRYVKLFGVPE